MPESIGQRQAGNNDIITVDVRRTYSSKKELILQDIMDVEYIVLETNDDFLHQGHVMDIGKEIILVTNKINDGDIFVYDRTGKALRKINRKGQGGEEYLWASQIRLDENNGEMLVSDQMTRKIYVYDLFGNFKRSFNQNQSVTGSYIQKFNYDANNLICYNPFCEEIGFDVVSKKDGSITKEIKIPFVKKKTLSQNAPNPQPGFFGPRTAVSPPNAVQTIIPYYGNWILFEFSSDTIYQFLPDYGLRPLIVRTPSIQSMDPEIMLVLRLFSDRYFFFETIQNTYDFSKDRGFPSKYIMYDKQEKNVFEYALFNGDYSTKNEIHMTISRPVNHEITSWYTLNAYRLVEDYEKGVLKGRLKEIAARMDAEDNPVIMLIKHRK